MLFAAVHESASGIVSRVTPVHTAVRNCTRDEGGPFEVGNQVLISSHRKLLSSKAMVVNVAEIPMIAFLSSGSQQADVWRLAEFRRGLRETGADRIGDDRRRGRERTG